MIDYKDLQQEVMDKWDSEGRKFAHYDCVDTEYPLYEWQIDDWADIILNNPRLMLCELGYNDNDWSTYVRERTE